MLMFQMLSDWSHAGNNCENIIIVTNDSDSVTKVQVIVEFDNTNVGLKILQTSPFRSTFPGGVPISKYEVQFPAKGTRGAAEVTRLQFPLTLHCHGLQQYTKYRD